MSDMIDHAECVALTNQILEETKQAYTMLRMLQEHNARNIKESKVVTGFVQEVAMGSFEDFIQNPVLSEATIQSIQEGKLQDAFDKLKSNMVASNQRFLKRHKEAALASKCDGITIEKWYEAKDLNKLYKDAMSAVKKEMDPETKDLGELKDRWKEIRGSIWLGGADSKGIAISSKMLDGKQMAWVKDLAHTIFRKKKITPSGIKDAVKFLENSDIEINKANHDLMRASAVTAGSLYTPNTLLRTRGEAYVKKINTFMQYIIDNINLNYQKMLLSQLKIKQQQSRMIILKAARVSSNEAMEILEKDFAIIESAFTECEIEMCP